MTHTEAPWTSAEVEALNEWQHSLQTHPFTCANGHGALVATRHGWVCEECDYRQTWAHEFMLRAVASREAREEARG